MRNCTWELLLDQETEQSVYVFSTHLHDPMGAAADEVRPLQTQYLLEKAAQVMQAHLEASSLIMGDFKPGPTTLRPPPRKIAITKIWRPR